MTNAATNSASPTTAAATDSKQIILKDIGAKWGKFSEQDLSALKDKDDLVTQVVAKYSMEKPQAQLFRAVGRKRKAEAWPAGAYQATTSLIRKGQTIGSETVAIRVSP